MAVQSNLINKEDIACNIVAQPASAEDAEVVVFFNQTSDISLDSSEEVTSCYVLGYN